MAQLIFYDQNHTYEVDGVKVPSVSEIIRFISREEYGDVNQYALDNAAERGTNIHKACEQLIKFGDAEISENIAGYIKAFVKFCKDHVCDFLHTEKALACADYAGTIDAIGTIDGELSIIDFKSSSVVKKTLVKAQLNGYNKLIVENLKLDIKKLYCLQLMPNENYRLYPVAIDSTEFNACLAIHKAMIKKHTRGNID